MTSSELIKELQRYDPNTIVGKYKWTEGRFDDYERFVPYSVVKLDRGNLIIY